MNSIRVVSDLVCPWCYVGKRRLEEALQSLPPREARFVSWHPFQLNPALAPEGMDRKEYCIQKFGSWAHCEEMFERISQIGKTVGLDFRFDLQRRIPNTLDSHRLIWFAGEADVQDAVVEGLFRAYFCEGVDLSKRGNLLEVAVDSGLERAEVEQLLGSDRGLAEVKAQEQEVKDLGVSSVPLFILRNCVAVSGAQPPEVLLDGWRQAREMQERPTPKT